MAKSKIHRARVTDANLKYVGSITIDAALLDAADIAPYERVQVVNCNNGARLETYTIPGPPGAGDICLNGAAARLCQPDDIVIIISYAWLTDEECQSGYKPKIVFVDEQNHAAVRSDT